jgi:hypothetical protein
MADRFQTLRTIQLTPIFQEQYYLVIIFDNTINLLHKPELTNGNYACLIY